MSNQKGVRYYEKGLKLRAQKCYKLAGNYLYKAANMGVGDACWEIARAYEYGGLCLFSGQHDAAFEYYQKGADAGNFLCKQNITYPIYASTLLERLYCWKIYIDRPFTTNAEEEELIAMANDSQSPWFLYILGSYLEALPSPARKCEGQQCIGRSVELGLAEAQSKCRETYGCIEGTRQFNFDSAFLFLTNLTDSPDNFVSFGVKDFTANDIFLAFYIVFSDYVFDADIPFPMLLKKIVFKNTFYLPIGMLLELKCRLGYHFKRSLHTYIILPDEASECILYYEACKKRAQRACIAWLGCFKRKKLDYFSKDTARIVAKLMFDPIYFLL
jgi:hypothetical protein